MSYFSRLEKNEIAHALREWTPNKYVPYRYSTFARWIMQWRHCVENVERGYDYPLSNYIADLEVRKHIADVMLYLSADTSVKVATLLVDLDKRFMMATGKPSRPIPGLERMITPRLPRKLIGRLRADYERVAVV